MIRKTWIINLLLAVVAVSFFIKAFQSWHHSSLSHKVKADSLVENRFNPHGINRNRKTANEYEAVAAYNLFSPDRAEEKPVKNVKKLQTAAKKVVSETPPPKLIEQNYRLYGIIYQNEKTRALLKAPVQDKKENPVRWISVGDKLNEFTVSEIYPDRITITDGSVKYGIPIHIEKKVDNPQASMASAAAPTGATQKTSEKPTVIDTNVQNSKNVTQEDQSVDGDVIIDGNYKIIETPFGKSRIRID